jgi:hypothetical protein
MRNKALFRIRHYYRYTYWCPEEDSNLHGITRQHLKLVRLPIPPPGQEAAILSERPDLIK